MPVLLYPTSNALLSDHVVSIERCGSAQRCHLTNCLLLDKTMEILCPAKKLVRYVGSVSSHTQPLDKAGTFARCALDTRHPNQYSGHLSQCFTPKHHSLLQPTNPRHNRAELRVN